MSEHRLMSAQEPPDRDACEWPVWEVQGHGTVTVAGDPRDGAGRCELLPPWVDVRLTFQDGARIDVLAVVREGRIAIEDAQADPPLALEGFAALADAIEAPLQNACQVVAGPHRPPVPQPGPVPPPEGRSGPAEAADAMDASSASGASGTESTAGMAGPPERPTPPAGLHAGPVPGTDAWPGHMTRPGPGTETDPVPTPGTPAAPEAAPPEGPTVSEPPTSAETPTTPETPKISGTPAVSEPPSLAGTPATAEPQAAVPVAPAPSVAPTAPGDPSGGERGPVESGRHRARTSASRGGAARRGVAEIYRAAQSAGQDPVLAVMSATGFSRRKALRLIAGARDDGHLSPRHHRR
ncbi:DUF6214 family protein [Streptomyces sp. NPDC056987]|uniref:DUF6214 family protein n=1 Tax=Streptomyces sp. NPDC056987 TaxID=3345988 RepID=UPI00363C2C68